MGPMRHVGYTANIGSMSEPSAKTVRRIPRSIHRPILWIIDHAPFGAEKLLRLYNRILRFIGGPYRAQMISGANIDCDPQDLIQQYILHFGVWEPGVTSLITQVIRPGDVFVDVGANIGYDTLLAANLAGDHGRVLAFEASPKIFDSLLHNIDLNTYTNIIPRQVAVSDRVHRLQLHSGPPGNIGQTTTVTTRGFSQECEVQGYPLTQLISDVDRSRIRLIKIDIEGGEIPVINDFLANLASFPENADLIVEVNPSPEWEATFENLLNSGFHAFAIPNPYDRTWYIKNRRNITPPTPIDRLPDTQIDIFFTRQANSHHHQGRRDRRMLRIGVAFPGNPEDPMVWSGTPSAIVGALRACGFEPVPIHTGVRPEPMRRLTRGLLAMGFIRIRNLRQGWRTARRLATSAAAVSPQNGALETYMGRRTLREAGPLDAIIQIGCGYRLDTDAPIVTFEDMTVRQAIENSYPGWNLLSGRAVGRRLESQKSAYERAVAVCVMTPWAAESVISSYGVAPEKVRVVGVGPNHVVDVGNSRKNGAQPRFLFVASDWGWKNGESVIRAFDRLRRTEVPDARLDLVGDAPNKVFPPGVFRFGRLRLDSPTDRLTLDELFGSATCFVMPSNCDAAGIVYVEAAFAGIPSICSDAGGSSFLVGDGGLVVKPNDEDGLLEAMLALSDPAKAAEAGGFAKSRARFFTWEAVAERLVEAAFSEPNSW